MSQSTIRILFCGFVCFYSFSLLAHEGGSSEHHVSKEGSSFTGALELRPTIESDSGNVFGENTFELGYRPSENLTIGFQQEFHHNISIKDENPEHEGLGLHLEESYLNAQIQNVWESGDEISTLSLEPRLYLPTSTEDREKGFQTAVTSYLKYRRQFNETASLTVTDAPVLFIYSAPGATLGEEFEANPNFQNRFRVAADLSLFNKKVNVSLPVLFYLTRHSDYDPEAHHNNSWSKFVGLAPEINYLLAENFSVGAAVITPNLLDSQDSDHSVNHGRTSTVSQLILRAQM